jgi:hypothetical protein
VYIRRPVDKRSGGRAGDALPETKAGKEPARGAPLSWKTTCQAPSETRVQAALCSNPTTVCILFFSKNGSKVPHPLHQNDAHGLIY